MPRREPTAEESAQTDADWPEQPSSDVELASVNGGLMASMSPSDLKALSFDDLSNMAVVTSDDAIGQDQFGPILENKDRLVGTPFVILAWRFTTKGTFGRFVTMFVMTKDNQRFIVNDGSTGIAEQLWEYTSHAGDDNRPIVCAGGLRVSEYDYTDPNTGRTSPAKTYYLEAQQRVR